MGGHAAPVEVVVEDLRSRVEGGALHRLDDLQQRLLRQVRVRILKVEQT